MAGGGGGGRLGLPLPLVVHDVLAEEDIGSTRVIVVGDIHGCNEELVDLLKKVGRKDDDVVVFVGDLVNKGPGSRQVLQTIMALGSCARTVRGNHDDAALAAALHHKATGESLMGSKYEWASEATDDELNFLSNLPYSLRIPSRNSIVVHAGLIPGVPLEEQRLDDLCQMRNVVNASEMSSSDVGSAEGVSTRSNRSEQQTSTSGQQQEEQQHYEQRAPEGLIGIDATDKGTAWAELWRGPEHVYFGHDAPRRLQCHEFATGLDTGCCYGAQLTACILPSKEETGMLRGMLVSVAARSTYEKPKKLRSGYGPNGVAGWGPNSPP
eukprot:jgi/Chlat1/8365/Chrsp80S07797